MHALARDMTKATAIPSVEKLLLQGKFRAALAYCFGQAYVTFFRIHGPFATAECLKIAETELFAPVKNRGVIANLTFLAVGILFAGINSASYLIEHILILARHFRRAFSRFANI